MARRASRAGRVTPGEETSALKTAVDTSVLIAIAKGERDAGAWIELLIRARSEGEVVVCDVVAAEFFAALMDAKKFRRSLRDLGIAFSSTSLAASTLAGRIFKEYRRQGGPREHLLPDFLIGAHASEHADRIAAIDRGYLKRYFTRLAVLRP
ncbi:MAG: type II toxin-antitoxin system VapC family toxin [Candidatus Binatia bacterium]